MASRFFLINLVAGLLMLVSSCNSTEKANEPLTANHCKIQELGAYKYSVCLSAAEPDDPIDQNSEILQFVVKISRIGSKNNPIYENGEKMVSTLSEYYSFGVSKDVLLTDGESSVEPVLLNLIRNYNASPYVELLLTFDPKDLPNGAETLLINDRMLGGTLVKFPIKLKA